MKERLQVGSTPKRNIGVWVLDTPNWLRPSGGDGL